MNVQSVIMDIAPEVSETIEQMGLLIDRCDRIEFQSDVINLLLACVIYDDISYSTDEWQELVEIVAGDSSDTVKADLWGIYLDLQGMFFKEYAYDELLLRSLTSILDSYGPARDHPSMTKTFKTRWSKTGNYIQIERFSANEQCHPLT